MNTDLLHVESIHELVEFLSHSVPCWRLAYWDLHLLFHFSSCIYHLLCVLCTYMLSVLMTTTVALGRIRWSHGLRYNRSMLEYKVNKFPPWLFSTRSNTAIGREDTHAWQSPMETVTLILPLEATSVNNPIDISSNSGVTGGAIVEQHQERW